MSVKGAFIGRRPRSGEHSNGASLSKWQLR